MQPEVACLFLFTHRSCLFNFIYAIRNCMFIFIYAPEVVRYLCTRSCKHIYLYSMYIYFMHIYFYAHLFLCTFIFCTFIFMQIYFYLCTCSCNNFFFFAHKVQNLFYAPEVAKYSTSSCENINQKYCLNLKDQLSNNNSRKEE